MPLSSPQLAMSSGSCDPPIDTIAGVVADAVRQSLGQLNSRATGSPARPSTGRFVSQQPLETGPLVRQQPLETGPLFHGTQGELYSMHA